MGTAGGGMVNGSHHNVTANGEWFSSLCHSYGDGSHHNVTSNGDGPHHNVTSNGDGSHHNVTTHSSRGDE